MSPAQQRTRTRTPRKKKSAVPPWLATIWPLLLGILVTPFAVRAASVLAMSGPSALRLLYPYVIIVQGHLDHFPTGQEEALAQWVMYGQFPAYGVIWILARRFIRGSAGPLSAVILHCVGVATVIFTSNG